MPTDPDAHTNTRRRTPPTRRARGPGAHDGAHGGAERGMNTPRGAGGERKTPRQVRDLQRGEKMPSGL